MFLVKANTVIQIFAPFGKFGSKSTVVRDGFSWSDTAPWKPYTTKEDKFYDKDQVWDAVAVYNDAAGKRLAKFGDVAVFTEDHDLGDSSDEYVTRLLEQFKA